MNYFINNYKDIDDEKKTIEKYELNFNEQQKDILNKISLNKILLKIFKILNDLTCRQKAYTQLFETVKISVKLITIIMFIDIKDEVNIFEEYLKNILLLNKENIYVCLNQLSYSNQLILNQINEDKINLLVNFEENARKEILNSESLSKIENTKFIFSFYDNIIIIGLKTKKEKLTEILNNFITILFDIDNIPKEKIFTGYLTIIKDILLIFKNDNMKIDNFANDIILKFIIENYLIIDLIKIKKNHFQITNQ